ncbi:hypothetical protein ACISNL_06445 [Campylobacter jejuni]
MCKDQEYIEQMKTLLLKGFKDAKDDKVYQKEQLELAEAGINAVYYTHMTLPDEIAGVDQRGRVFSNTIT